jgi:hypothetical protein
MLDVTVGLWVPEMEPLPPFTSEVCLYQEGSQVYKSLCPNYTLLAVQEYSPATHGQTDRIATRNSL